MELRGGLMIWVLLMCYIFGHIISYSNGIVEAKSLSELDDLEIEKILKTRNKPAVEIIKTIDGEEYGCVDFFKQRAFDHPSMKNHTYHYNMRMTWYPKGMKQENTNNSDIGFGHLWENGVGCPIGTVPILRVTKEDLLRLHSLDEKERFEPRGSWNNTAYDPNNIVHYDQHHYAVARTKNIGMSYNGATMDLKITAPKVRPPKQFSAARLHFQLGYDIIQTGYIVNPAIYRDTQPRTYVYTKAGAKSCWNHDCDVGMVSVRRDFPMGMAVKPVSVRLSIQNYGSRFAITKDKGTGNWWLHYGVKSIALGFWPADRFSQSSGSFVEWGGEVFSAWQPSPQMGFGYFPLYRPRTDQFARRLTILDGNFNVDPKINHVEVFSDDIRGYGVGTGVDELKRYIGRAVFFGGPGNI